MNIQFKTILRAFMAFLVLGSISTVSLAENNLEDSNMEVKQGNVTINIQQMIIIDNGNHYIEIEKGGVQQYYIDKGKKDSIDIKDHKEIELGQ